MNFSDEEARRVAEKLRLMQSIEKEMLLRLLTSNDIHVLGAAYDAICEPDIVSRVQPALDSDEVYSFVRFYLSRCIVEDPTSSFADSRYSACHSAARWLKQFGGSSDPNRPFLGFDWIILLYKSHDSSVKLAIETGIFEHLSRKQAHELLSRWGADPEVSAALKRSGF